MGQLDRSSEYEASPVPHAMLYVIKMFLEVNDVHEAEGALVEVHFELRHFAFTGKAKTHSTPP